MSRRHLPKKFLHKQPKRPQARKLSARQQLFVAEYLKNLNGAQAVIRAGYSPNGATVTAAQLLASTSVGESVAKAIEARLRGIDSTGERVIIEAAGIAHSDIREALTPTGDVMNPKELPDGIARAVSAIRRTTTPDGKTTTEIRLWDKVAALTLLAKYHKLLTEKLEVSGSVEVRPIAGMSDAEILSELQANRQAIDVAIEGRQPIKRLPEPSFS